MKRSYTYESISGSTSFNPTCQNTSCTGGTVTDIFVSTVDEESNTSSYGITVKELMSYDGFENVTKMEAYSIIQSLHQLSAITYQALYNE